MAPAELYLALVPGKGRGVFSRQALDADVIVESAPVIVMSQEDRLLLDKTTLHDYIFTWGYEQNQCAMALGWIPLFNHSYQSNCEYFMDYEEAMMFVKTVRPIAANEELTINYNGNWNDETPIWFEALPTP